VTASGGWSASDSGSVERPCGGAMDEVAGDALARATGHGFRRGLILRDQGDNASSPR
jgi:hypothetical protein